MFRTLCLVRTLGCIGLGWEGWQRPGWAVVQGLGSEGVHEPGLWGRYRSHTGRECRFSLWSVSVHTCTSTHTYEHIYTYTELNTRLG